MADVAPDFTDSLDGDYVSGIVSVPIGSDVLLCANGTTNLTSREFLLIYNDGNKDIYVGPPGVTKTASTKGITVFPGESMSFKVSANVNIHAISDVGNVNVICQEWAT